jgi:spore coat protein U-like protein
MLSIIWKSRLTSLQAVLKIAAALSVFMCAVPSIALAQQQVSIQVEGQIKPHCAFQQSESASASPSFDVAFGVEPERADWVGQSHKLAINLTCNAPFTVTAQSSQGGLRHEAPTAKGIGGNFSNQIAYNLLLNVSTEDAASPLVLDCRSSEMMLSGTTCGASSGTHVAIGAQAGVGELAITLNDSAGFPIQGRYQDTIVLALAFQ